MLQALRRQLIVLAAVLVALPAQAAPTKATVENVLAAFHTQDFLNDGITFIEGALTRRKKEVKVTPKRASDLLALARRIYPGKNLLTVFKVAYSKQTTLENMEALYTFLNTPAGIKLRRAYDQAYAVDASTRQTYYVKTGKTLLKPNRQNAFDTYMTTTKQYAVHGTWMTGSDLGIFRGLNGFLPPAERLASKTIEEQIATRKNGYIAAGKMFYIPFNTYLFKDMKNEDIDNITQFAATPAGEGHAKAYIAALEGTLASAAATLETQVAKLGGH